MLFAESIIAYWTRDRVYPFQTDKDAGTIHTDHSLFV